MRGLSHAYGKIEILGMENTLPFEERSDDTAINYDMRTLGMIGLRYYCDKIVARL